MYKFADISVWDMFKLYPYCVSIWIERCPWDCKFYSRYGLYWNIGK